MRPRSTHPRPDPTKYSRLWPGQPKLRGIHRTVNMRILAGSLPEFQVIFILNLYTNFFLFFRSIRFNNNFIPTYCPHYPLKYQGNLRRFIGYVIAKTRNLEKCLFLVAKITLFSYNNKLNGKSSIHESPCVPMRIDFERTNESTFRIALTHS